MARRSSSEFVNLTLTEFLMVVIFILITLLFYSFQKSEAVDTDVLLTPEESELIAANATRLNQELFGDDDATATPTEQVISFFENMEKALAEPGAAMVLEETSLPEIWDTLITTERRKNELQSKVTELTEAVKSQADRKYIDKLASEKAKAEVELARIEKVQKKFEQLYAKYKVKTPEEFTRKALDVLAQHRDLTERAKREGIGAPLCWVGQGGGREFLFSIAVLEEGTFLLTPIYPESREADIKSIGYGWGRLPRTLSVQQFKKEMQAFWDYGQKNYGCRFFVKVQDKTKSKERWKYGLALVENYFYKQEI